MQRFFQKGNYGLCNISDDGKKALGQPIKPSAENWILVNNKDSEVTTASR